MLYKQPVSYRFKMDHIFFSYAGFYFYIRLFFQKGYGIGKADPKTGDPLFCFWIDLLFSVCFCHPQRNRPILQPAQIFSVVPDGFVFLAYYYALFSKDPWKSFDSSNRRTPYRLYTTRKFFSIPRTLFFYPFFWPDITSRKAGLTQSAGSGNTLRQAGRELRWRWEDGCFLQATNCRLSSFMEDILMKIWGWPMDGDCWSVWHVMEFLFVFSSPYVP